MARYQIPLYLAAIVLGAAVGLLVPTIAHPAEAATNPVLGLVLYATFLGVPFAKIGQAFRDWRFLTTVFVVNFVLVPIVVFLLSRIVAHDQVLLVGVLFVLLTPCGLRHRVHRHRRWGEGTAAGGRAAADARPDAPAAVLPVVVRRCRVRRGGRPWPPSPRRSCCSLSCPS